jgi:hypothetical protein
MRAFSYFLDDMEDRTPETTCSIYTGIKTFDSKSTSSHLACIIYISTIWIAHEAAHSCYIIVNILILFDLNGKSCHLLWPLIAVSLEINISITDGVFEINGQTSLRILLMLSTKGCLKWPKWVEE